ncbi:hypothetical protein OG884_18450 [Streptosporangium sp. NBC_01755]|uniref:hypothetical protein n=1 Tax=Streptosporangium sp. NBC_01755 TaxID=2975949 RepID=UPI002DD9019D|nr:hypothetical protein [Streptosporangium sp. NBC_01755]WSD01496.1 hypothetical protein OG884_06085 [Streptosporangium sp. NBC_01755]WSD03788.1 hypothetical protein OG884_18450 [Streptosporangium sp. NBC_01755]
MPEVRHPLAGMLAVVVPLEIDRMRAMNDEQRTQQIAEHASRTVAQLLGEQGDVLLYGGRGCAETFAVLARGLVCLAWAPGGVTAFGMHFCARHEECEKADAELAAREASCV